MPPTVRYQWVQRAAHSTPTSAATDVQTVFKALFAKLPGAVPGCLVPHCRGDIRAAPSQTEQPLQSQQCEPTHCWAPAGPYPELTAQSPCLCWVCAVSLTPVFSLMEKPRVHSGPPPHRCPALLPDGLSSPQLCCPRQPHTFSLGIFFFPQPSQVNGNFGQTSS